MSSGASGSGAFHDTVPLLTFFGPLQDKGRKPIRQTINRPRLRPWLKGPQAEVTRAQRTGELSEDIRALQENPDCTKEPLCKYIFSVDVYEDLIGIRSTADWAKGNADVPFMKEVKTNYAASNEADGVIIDGMS